MVQNNTSHWSIAIQSDRIKFTLQYAQRLKERGELEGKEVLIIKAIYGSSMARGDSENDTLRLGMELMVLFDDEELDIKHIHSYYSDAFNNYKEYLNLSDKSYYNSIGLDIITMDNLGFDNLLTREDKAELIQHEKRKENLEIGKTLYYNRRKKAANRVTQKELYQLFDISKNTIKKYEEIYKAMRSNSDYEKVKDKVNIKKESEYNKYIIAYKDMM